MAGSRTRLSVSARSPWRRACAADSSPSSPVKVKLARIMPLVRVIVKWFARLLMPRYYFIWFFCDYRSGHCLPEEAVLCHHNSLHCSHPSCAESAWLVNPGHAAASMVPGANQLEFSSRSGCERSLCSQSVSPYLLGDQAPNRYFNLNSN